MTTEDYKQAAIKLNEFNRWMYLNKNGTLLRIFEEMRKEWEPAINKMNNEMWQIIINNNKHQKLC